MSATMTLSLKKVFPAAWAQRWHGLERRQRQIIVGGAGVAIIALLFAYVWLPLERERTQLATRLPQLHARLADMQRQVEEIKLVRSAPPVAITTRALDAQALRAAFSGSEVTVNALGNQRFRLLIAATAYSTWIDELKRLQSQSVVRVDEAKLISLAEAAQSGMVKVDATFSSTTAAR